MSFDADAEEEEDPLIPGDHLTETRDKGGCPTGSTIEHYRAQELARKQAVNFVVIKYIMHLEEKEEKGKERLESGIRKKLVDRAFEVFQIEGKFDVPKQTIFNRIASEQLEVWHDPPPMQTAQLIPPMWKQILPVGRCSHCLVTSARGTTLW
jgi:hypothetical protein